MSTNIKPKNVIIVGGGSGIGFAVAQRLLTGGVDSVILASRNIDKLNNAKKRLSITDNQHVFCVKYDITDCQKNIALLQNIQQILGVIPDGLVISSGVVVGHSHWRGFNVTEDTYDKVMDTNLKGAFFLLRDFSNYIYEHKIKGNICVVSSVSAHRDLLSVYQISKNAISGIVSAYGKHLARRGIILNCVEPGICETDMMSWLGKYRDGIREGEIWKDNGIGRIIRPEEIAETIAFLMSDQSEVLAGTCLLAAGGVKSIIR